MSSAEAMERSTTATATGVEGRKESVERIKRKKRKKAKARLTYRAAVKLMERYGAKGRVSVLFVIALCCITTIGLFAITTQDAVQYNQVARRADTSSWWRSKLALSAKS